MSIRKVIWMLVMIMTFGAGAPAAVYADTADLALDAIEQAAKTTKKKKKSQETTEAKTEETRPETSQDTTDPVIEEIEDKAEEKADKDSPEKAPSKKETEEASALDGITDLEDLLHKQQEKIEREAELAESEEQMEQEAAREEEEATTNEELLSKQHIVMPEITEMAYEFRFARDEEAPQALLQPGTCIYEGQSEEAPVVGVSVTGSVVYVLADAEEEWVYIESGVVRGFVRSGDLMAEDALASIIADGDPSIYRDAYAIIAPMDNMVVDYTLTTGYDVVLEDAEPVVAAADLSIYGTMDMEAEDAVVAGTLKKNGMAYVLEEVDEDILYVESGDVRGFIRAEEVLRGEEAEAKLAKKSKKSKETKSPVLAESEISPEENPALRYTLTSVKEPIADAQLRSSIVNFATQFVGNPYVWGGQSLTNGADCSGFVKQVYQYFGYELPRTSRVQARYGTQIPISAALPGDLIFYAKHGTVYHVAMYIGDGKTVQARNARSGIVICPIGSNAVWATRVLGD